MIVGFDLFAQGNFALPGSETDYSERLNWNEVCQAPVTTWDTIEAPEREIRRCDDYVS